MTKNLHMSARMCTFAHTIFGKTKSKYHKSSFSSAKMFYICCLFSFQRTVVLNVTGAKPTPTQLQMNTVALWISWEGWRKQFSKVFNLTTAWRRGKNIPPRKTIRWCFSEPWKSFLCVNYAFITALSHEELLFCIFHYKSRK